MKQKQIKIIEISASAILTLTIFFALRLNAQSNVIELRSANELIGKVINNEQVQELIGNVYFVQPAPEGKTVRVWCDRAIRYLAENRIELFSNVRIVKDSTVLTSNEAIYYGEQRRAIINTGVKLRRGNNFSLNSLFGEYFSDEKKIHFKTNVVIIDSISRTTCDDLWVFEKDSVYIATGTVVVHDLRNAITIFGDSLYHNELNKYSIVPKNPLMMQIDTASDGSIDTLLVSGKIMEAYHDTASERFIAKDSVIMAQTKLSASCAESIYYSKKGSIVLKQKPILWYDQNQLTGDTIFIALENKRLKSVRSSERAMAISRSDSLYANRFDQITGRYLTMFFENDEIKQIKVGPTATSLYYLFDNGKPNGASKSSGDQIIIDFENRKASSLRVIGGVQGVYYPEAMLEKRESEYNLEGFRWHRLRPRHHKLQISIEPYE